MPDNKDLLRNTPDEDSGVYLRNRKPENKTGNKNPIDLDVKGEPIAKGAGSILNDSDFTKKDFGNQRNERDRDRFLENFLSP